MRARANTTNRQTMSNISMTNQLKIVTD